jgi:tRNA U55 pseudouridine synthase TruB
VSALVRTRSAGVVLTETWTLDEIEARWDHPDKVILPLEKLHFGVPRWRIPEGSEGVYRLTHGQRFVVNANVWRAGSMEPHEQTSALSADERHCVLFTPEGRVMGIGSYRFRPEGDVELTTKRGMS